VISRTIVIILGRFISCQSSKVFYVYVREAVQSMCHQILERDWCCLCVCVCFRLG